jgi:hypothetical protein
MMRALLATSCVILGLVLGCGGSDESAPGESTGASSESASEPGAPSADERARWFGIESFTVVRKLEGMQTGTVTEHVRDWGNERVEIRDTEINIAGFRQTQKQRVISQGDSIVSVDLQAGTATRTKNPMYADMAKAGPGVGKAFIEQMGGRATGESAEYAGQACQVWKIAQLGQTLCLTEDGLNLHSANQLAQISETAIEVRLGDPGPDAAYQVPEGIDVQEGPDIAEIMGERSPPPAPGSDQPVDPMELMKQLGERGGAPPPEDMQKLLEQFGQPAP